MWNNVISPVVKEAVIKNSGKEASDIGQQKVVSTALYVLMQRAVVPGCPLLGQGNQLFLNNYDRLQDFGIDLLLPLYDKGIFFVRSIILENIFIINTLLVQWSL